MREKDAVSKMYDRYRGEFISFARKYYDVPPEEAQGIYNESFAKLCQNLRENKYKESGCSLRTYLFGIGKNYIKKYWGGEEKNNRIKRIPPEEWLHQYFKDDEWEEAQEVASRLVRESATDCNKVIQLFYLERKKMREIADLMDYATEQVAKNKRRSCLQKMTIELRRRLQKIGINWR